ncbi:MAG: polyphosphate kinase [marine bacterium B5-7]|nr:MAG: polyphosphate kinase [marine bacterium B5-7]
MTPNSKSEAKVTTIPADNISVASKASVNRRPVDLSKPSLYQNREITWLRFNQRVLSMSRDDSTPLLERLKFIAIVSSNLDEFYMKRIGGLMQQEGAGYSELTIDGLSPKEQIELCSRFINTLEAEIEESLTALLKRLPEYDIQICQYDTLDHDEQHVLRRFYLENIFPLITPQAVDPAHPFPFISNLSLNLLVTLHHPDSEFSSLARVKVPVGSGTKRFIPIGKSNRFVPIEQIMAGNLDLLFPGMLIDRCEVFRVIRNASTERNEASANDLLEMIVSELRERKFAPIVKLLVHKDMNPSRRGMLSAELGLNEETNVLDSTGLMAKRDLIELSTLQIPRLRDVPHRPVDHFKLLETRSIFHIIREHGDILLQHPYESFATSVLRFLQEASRDPKVRAIKMTLYRTADQSKIVDCLIEAARNGKQVAVAVELKAQFDEMANVRWASHMEEAGVHVTYGVVGLKTHSKVIMVVRQDFNGIRCYVHIGTGNYHEGTAQLYCDLGLLTCDREIASDIAEFFNFLTTGYTPNRNYKKIIPAPRIMKSVLINRIRREIKLHKNGEPGHIQFKCNALEDFDIAKELYRASMAGVTVDLIIRDSCRVKVGIKGLSENIRVISIVGRFLEHSRIYYFRNGGDENEEYYIGSADLMKRNLESRVEILTPVQSVDLKQDLRMILNTYMNDRHGAWEMQPDGNYRSLRTEGEKSSQDKFVEMATNRYQAARKQNLRKLDNLRMRGKSRTI